ncbi:MAG TPA: mechanosensitive ion channel family protein [Methylophilaceae bacterium]|jgi:small conductance mechanosensitive channel
MTNIFSDINSSDLKEMLTISQSTLHIILILLIAFIAVRAASKLIGIFHTFLLDRVDNNLEELKRIETLSRAFHYITSVVITIITGTLVLSELGISIAPILAAAGVIGVAAGFGAQSLVKDYLSGFFLLLENQIRQGDVVEIAGKGGLVEEMTLRYVKLRDYEGYVHFIPNGTITAVTNMSQEFAYAVIDIRVAYKENLDDIMQMMREIGTEIRQDPTFSSKILDDIEIAGVDALADSAVIIKSRFKVHALAQWDVKREFFRRIKHRFYDKNIEIPYPHMTVSPR